MANEQIAEKHQPLDVILQGLERRFPKRAEEVWFLVMPRDANDGITAWQYCPDDYWSESCRMRMINVNPFSADIIKSQYFHTSIDESLVLWLYKLHVSLLLGELGAQIAGIVALLMAVSIIIGFYLWWPRGNNYKQAFIIKKKASKRV